MKTPSEIHRSPSDSSHFSTFIAFLDTIFTMEHSNTSQKLSLDTMPLTGHSLNLTCTAASEEPLVESGVLVLPSGDSLVPSSDMTIDCSSPTAEGSESRFKAIFEGLESCMEEMEKSTDRMAAIAYRLDAYPTGKAFYIQMINATLVRVERRLQRQGFCGDRKKRARQLFANEVKATPGKFRAILDASQARTHRLEAAVMEGIVSIRKGMTSFEGKAEKCVAIVDGARRRNEKTKMALRRFIREDRRRNKARGPRPILARSPKPCDPKKL